MAALTDGPSVDLAAALVLNPVNPADWLLVSPMIVTLAGGALCLMSRNNIGLQRRLALSFLAALVFFASCLFFHIEQSGPTTMVMGRWLPPFGIAFSADLTGALLVLISSIVAFAGGVFSLGDIDAKRIRYGFYPFLLLLMTGVCGAFLTGDIFNLYVWFEVLLIASFGLLVLGNEKPQLDGAVKYALLNLIATTLFLVATGLLYGLVGTLNMADIALKLRVLDHEGPIVTIAALYLLAFGMKAAAFPVNFWLPASYHTPRIVISALFAGLLTKVGIYALLRVLVMLMPEGRSELSWVIGAVAIATMAVGVFGALAQNDMRRLVGYLVISGIGAMLAGLAIGTQSAIMGVIIYAVHSIIAICALYFVIGLMRHLSGTFLLNRIGGLYPAYNLEAGIFLILALAVAGLPPFSGFWPKVTLVGAALESDHSALAFAILASGLLTSLAVGRVFLLAFWRPKLSGAADGQIEDDTQIETSDLAHKWFARLPVFLLLFLVIMIGLLPNGLLVVAQNGAGDLFSASGYIESVFGGGK